MRKDNKIKNKMKNKNNPLVVSDLRKNAEEFIKNCQSKTKNKTPPSEIDMMKLIHELEVHQIELEMQNDELLQAKDELKATSEKYIELFDFSPLSYFTLSKEGKIMELNHSGAEMLGMERCMLNNKSFKLFVYEETKFIFNSFLENVFNDGSKKSCEVILITSGNLPIYVQMTGVAIKDKEQCLVTVVDITVRKKTEKQLIDSNKVLQFNMDRIENFSLFAVDRELRINTLKEKIKDLEDSRDL